MSDTTHFEKVPYELLQVRGVTTTGMANNCDIKNYDIKIVVILHIL